MTAEVTVKVAVCASFKDANRSDYRQVRIEGQGDGGKGGREEREEMTAGWTLLMNGSRGRSR